MPSINHHIMTIARSSNLFRSERLQGTGLCGPHCPYILRVCREPGTTQEAIARALCMNKSSVARQLASLEQSGFVERRPCPTDSRAMEVYPTQKAFDALPAVRAMLAEWNERITDGFSDEERALFAALAERAAANARAEIERIRGAEADG